MDVLLDLATNAGPMVALVIFFVWSDSKRDERNAEATAELHKYIRERLEGQVESTNEKITEFRDEARKVAALVRENRLLIDSHLRNDRDDDSQ